MTTRIHVNKDSSIHGTVRGGGMTLKVCMDSKKTTGNELKRRLDVLEEGGTLVFPFRDTLLKLERNPDGRYDLSSTTKVTVSDETARSIVGVLEGMADLCSGGDEPLHGVSSQSNLLASQ